MGSTTWTRRRHLKRKLTFARNHLDQAGALVWAAAAEYRAAERGPYEELEAIAHAIAQTLEALETVVEAV
jgi:multidrug resistance efflux pump